MTGLRPAKPGHAPAGKLAVARLFVLELSDGLVVSMKPDGRSCESPPTQM